LRSPHQLLRTSVTKHTSFSLFLILLQLSLFGASTQRHHTSISNPWIFCSCLTRTEIRRLRRSELSIRELFNGMWFRGLGLRSMRQRQERKVDLRRRWVILSQLKQVLRFLSQFTLSTRDKSVR